MLKKRR